MDKGILGSTITKGEPMHSKSTNLIISQGRALVRAIEAIDSIAPSGWFERWQARSLRVIYEHRLHEIVKTAPVWIAEEILAAREQVNEGPSGSVDE